jgi:uncharacterized protein YhaN
VRVHRIRLRDYKGVEDAEVEFASEGVTIVEGPNEVGKTSLAEALTIALEQLDSSTRQDIRDAKPVHRDAGPWVEVELSTGPYRLIIEKRWLRSPMTHLRVLEPKAEEMTGREAHDRLRSIIAETLDEQLFRALHHYQGVTIEQAALGQSTSLSSALDAAASGESLAGQREASLVDLVQGERLRYFTPTGRPSIERATAAKELNLLCAAVDGARAELDALDVLGDEHRSLVADIARLGAEQVAVVRAFDDASRFWESVQMRKVAVAQAAMINATTLGAEHEAQRQVDDRNALRATEATTASRRASAEVAAETDRPAIEEAYVAVQKASARRDAARLERLDAEAAEHSARGREEFARRLVSRELWAERLANVRSGQAKLADARNVLVANRLDEQRLVAIESVSLSLTEASARLAASSAVVKFEALDSVSLRSDGFARVLERGEAFEARVDDVLTFELGELVRVTVIGGSPEAQLREALETAEAEFRELLADAGVPQDATVAQCRLAAQQRRDSEASADQAAKLIADSLRDLTIERLELEVAEDEEFLSSFAKHKGADAALAISLEEARAALVAAERVTALAMVEEDASTAQLEAARVHENEVIATVSTSVTELRVAISLHDGAVEALRLARALQPDVVLETVLAGHHRSAVVAGEELATAERSLAELDPASAEARLSNAKEVVTRLARDLGDAEKSLVAVETKLSVKGEEGLQDRLDDLATSLESKRRDLVRVERAARAADLLWTQLIANRERAQRAYVAPYQKEIERLGRIVYGGSFGVEIDHATLGIESRSLEGRTVAFDRLSTGAKEQLCVVARLACAGIVAGSDGDGAPVIIDDALGWTDQHRLERIGAAFSAAAHGCQVIVLTCDPARYRSVGSAVVRHLGVPIGP